MNTNLPRFLLSLLISTVLIFPVKTLAFVDNFDSNDSLSNYTIDSNGGSVTIAGGDMILTSPGNNHRYPYVRLLPSKLTLPINEVEITFKYEYIALFGAGIVIDDNVPINGSFYDVGQNSIVWTWNWGSPPTLKLGRYPFSYTVLPNQNGYHTLKIVGEPGNYNIYLDDAHQGSTSSTKEISSIWFGNPEVVNTTSGWPIIHISKITTNGGDIETSFPYYSQLDPLWAGTEYDSASQWAQPGQGTIGRWGCALTSVSMLLKNYNIKLPDGNEANPIQLNSWLQSQPDGYVGGGLLNWLAVSRMARLSRTAGYSDTDLEFVKSTGDPSSELSDGYYPIVNTGGHFVLTHAEEDYNYLINDPFNENNTELANTTTLESVNTFMPSDTNLAYILLVADPDIELTLPNSQTYLETLHDEESGQSITKKLVILSQPPANDYPLNVMGHQANDQIEVYLYDKLGNVSMDTIILTNSNPASFVIDYNPERKNNEVRVNTESILTYLKSLRTPKTPFNGIMQAVYSKFVEYLGYLTSGLDTSAFASELQKFVSKQSPKHISNETKQTIQKYIMLIEAN